MTLELLGFFLKYLFMGLIFFQTFLLANTVPIEFSEEEKAYLQTNPTIKVCVNPNLAPFEFLTLDGEYEGIGGNINTNKNFTHGKSFFMYNVCTSFYL